MLVFKNVSFKYNNDCVNILENLSFEINTGDFIAFVGVSGCGKSTIFRLINSLETPETGSVFLNNEPISRKKSKISFMPQKDLLLPWRSVEKNISLPLEILKYPKGERKDRVCEILKQVGLYEYRGKPPSSLSGGMRQRVSFARTMMLDSEVLLLDEPFSSLDYFTKIQMQDWLKEQLKNIKKTILFITHDVEEALFLADKIFIIEQSHPVKDIKLIKNIMPRPRKREFLKLEEVQDLKEHIIFSLQT